MPAILPAARAARQRRPPHPAGAAMVIPRPCSGYLFVTRWGNLYATRTRTIIGHASAVHGWPPFDARLPGAQSV